MAVGPMPRLPDKAAARSDRMSAWRFVATMTSGHEGVFRRKGKARLPIEELRGSRRVDALLHEGEAQGVAERGGKSFGETFTRVLPVEIGK